VIERPEERQRKAAKKKAAVTKKKRRRLCGVVSRRHWQVRIAEKATKDPVTRRKKPKSRPHAVSLFRNN